MILVLHFCLQLNLGGSISFGCLHSNCTPSPSIVPLQSQRNVTGGYVHFRKTSNATLLIMVHDQICGLTNSSVDFHPNSVIVVTWVNVTDTDESLQNGMVCYFSL